MKDSTVTKQSGNKSGFFSNIIAEIKKVNWLSRRELLNLTLMVLLVTVVLAVVLGGIDYGFSTLINWFISK